MSEGEIVVRRHTWPNGMERCMVVTNEEWPSTARATLDLIAQSGDHIRIEGGVVRFGAANGWADYEVVGAEPHGILLLSKLDSAVVPE